MEWQRVHRRMTEGALDGVAASAQEKHSVRSLTCMWSLDGTQVVVGTLQSLDLAVVTCYQEMDQPAKRPSNHMQLRPQSLIPAPAPNLSPQSYLPKV